MQSDVQGDIVFMEAPPFPLLWFASGVYSSSRWHHCPGWGEKILYKDTAWNPFIACLHFSTTHCYWIPKGSRSNVAQFAVFLFPGLASFHCGYILHCQISGHVTTMLFVCLQKLNTAMPPCHPSSAAERGKAWKGKAKARKTQVAGKGHSAPCGQKMHTVSFFSSATRRS